MSFGVIEDIALGTDDEKVWVVAQDFGGQLEMITERPYTTQGYAACLNIVHFLNGGAGPSPSSRMRPKVTEDGEGTGDVYLANKKSATTRGKIRPPGTPKPGSTRGPIKPPRNTYIAPASSKKLKG